MKKTTKIVALALVLVTLVALLASCNPSGKYHPSVLGVTSEDVYIEFKGNKVSSNVIGMKFEGASYKIKDDKITFTFKNDNGDKIDVGPFSYAKDGDTITIAGVKYVK